MRGGGRQDLVIVYSRLSEQRVPAYPGEPSSVKHDFEAQAAFLRVVLAGGTSLTTRIHGVDGAKAAWIDSVAHVNADPGDEIFLEVGRISSGATGVAYGFQRRKARPRGRGSVLRRRLGCACRFQLRVGQPTVPDPEVLHLRRSERLLPSWKESETIYAWHGPKLVRLSRRTFKQLVDLSWTGLASMRRVETIIGRGCPSGAG